MSGLLSILFSNKYIPLWVLTLFLMASFTGNYIIYFLGSILLFFNLNIDLVNAFARNKLRVFLLISMFGAFSLLGVNEFPISSFLLFAIPACTFFLLGNMLAKDYKDDSYYVGIFIIVALCVGIFNIFLSIKDMAIYGIVNVEVFTEQSSRGEGWKPGSLISAELAPLISCIALFFISAANNKQLQKISRIGFVSGVLALVCTLHFISRSAMFIAGVCILIGVIYVFSIKDKRRLWIVIILLLVGIYIFNSEFWNILQYKNESTEIYTANGRLQRQAYWLNQVLDNPFGVAGYREQSQIYAHNFWIDFAKDAGWIPGISLIIFSLLNIGDIYSILKNKRLSSNVKMFTFCMFSAFFLAFNVEPIFGGANNGMFAYFLFCGITSSLKDRKQF